MANAFLDLSESIGHNWTSVVGRMGFDYNTIINQMPSEIKYGSDASKAAFGIKYVLNNGYTYDDLDKALRAAGQVLYANKFRTAMDMPPAYDVIQSISNTPSYTPIQSISNTPSYTPIINEIQWKARFIQLIVYIDWTILANLLEAYTQNSFFSPFIIRACMTSSDRITMFSEWNFVMDRISRFYGNIRKIPDIKDIFINFVKNNSINKEYCDKALALLEA